MSYHIHITRYFFASGSPSTVGAINAPRFDTYELAEDAALKASVKQIDRQVIHIYSETIETVATATIKSESIVSKLRGAL